MHQDDAAAVRGSVRYTSYAVLEQCCTVPGNCFVNDAGAVVVVDDDDDDAASGMMSSSSTASDTTPGEC